MSVTGSQSYLAWVVDSSGQSRSASAFDASLDETWIFTDVHPQICLFRKSSRHIKRPGNGSVSLRNVPMTPLQFNVMATVVPASMLLRLKRAPACRPSAGTSWSAFAAAARCSNPQQSDPFKAVATASRSAFVEWALLVPAQSPSHSRTAPGQGAWRAQLEVKRLCRAVSGGGRGCSWSLCAAPVWTGVDAAVPPAATTADGRRRLSVRAVFDAATCLRVSVPGFPSTRLASRHMRLLTCRGLVVDNAIRVFLLLFLLFAVQCHRVKSVVCTCVSVCA